MAKKTMQPPKKRAPTAPQEEMTHLGVIVNLMLQMDGEARRRAIKYLNDRFEG